MSNNNDFENIAFDLPKNQSNVIKVIGVGGGGSNAINHMFQQGIKGVDFVICNTDAQALQNSGVPNKIQLGVNLTEGLGAGANPEVGEKAAVESLDDIKRMLDTNTKNGVYHCRNGRRNRNGSCSDHRQNGQGNEHSYRRDRHHALPV